MEIQRLDTHEEDPERRKDEADIVGKMMNMIGSLRDELAKLWTKNAVLEKELSELKPKEEPTEENPKPLEDKCVHCDAPPQEDKSCCEKPACEECDEFGKFAKSKSE
jgi:hypothetical protein